MERSRRGAVEQRLAARLRLHRTPLRWAGIAVTALGLVAIVWPVATSHLVGAMVGWCLWFAGGIMILVSFLVRGTGSFFGALLTGLTAVAAGAYLFFHPHAGSAALTVLLTAVLIIDGAFQIALALDLRPLAAWRWVLGSAIASIIAAMLFASGAPRDSETFIGVVLGVALATTGVAFLVLSRTRRRTAPPRRDRQPA